MRPPAPTSAAAALATVAAAVVLAPGALGCGSRTGIGPIDAGAGTVSPLDAGALVDARPDARRPIDAWVPPDAPPLCPGEREPIPLDATCERVDVSAFAGCGGDEGAAFDGAHCVPVRGCADRAAPFPDLGSCALACAAAGECDPENAPFDRSGPPTCTRCFLCDVVYFEARPDADHVPAICEIAGPFACGAREGPGVCQTARISAEDGVLRACALSLIGRLERPRCIVWL